MKKQVAGIGLEQRIKVDMVAFPTKIRITTLIDFLTKAMLKRYQMVYRLTICVGIKAVSILNTLSLLHKPRTLGEPLQPTVSVGMI